jgi:hypothetical protein
MAKKTKKEWSEDELILTFGLIREPHHSSLLDEWLAVKPATLLPNEEKDFNELLELSAQKADFWNEETLKMRFISPLLHFFVRLYDTQNRYDGFFDKEISATVNTSDILEMKNKET